MKIQAILFIPAFAVAACGQVKIDDVHVIHTVDFKSVEVYFKAMCAAEHPTFNSTQLTACSQTMLGELLAGIGE